MRRDEGGIVLNVTCEMFSVSKVEIASTSCSSSLERGDHGRITCVIRLQVGRSFRNSFGQ